MKREILIFVGGVVVGYLLFKVIPEKKVTTAVSDAAEKVTDTVKNAVQEVKKEVISDDQKMTLCEQKLAEAKKTMRFGSVEELHTYDTQFLADCMAASV